MCAPPMMRSSRLLMNSAIKGDAGNDRHTDADEQPNPPTPQ